MTVLKADVSLPLTLNPDTVDADSERTAPEGLKWCNGEQLLKTKSSVFQRQIHHK